MSPTGICFNVNCHATILQNARADQLLPHVKDCFTRGGVGLVSCLKCIEAFVAALAEKDTTHPPNTVCQICAGVNGSSCNLQLFANGEFSLWICEKCQGIQSSVINTNFYLPQKLVPVKLSVELFTFNLPKEAPKLKRAPPLIENRYEPPPKRRIHASFAASRQQQPWEATIIAATNQQAKIQAAFEEMEILQKQQEKNLRSIQAAVPSLMDIGSLKESNDHLQTKVDRISKRLEQAEGQKAKIKALADQLRSGNNQSIESILLELDELTKPLPEESEMANDQEMEKEEEFDISASHDDPMILASES